MAHDRFCLEFVWNACAGEVFFVILQGDWGTAPTIIEDSFNPLKEGDARREQVSGEWNMN